MRAPEAPGFYAKLQSYPDLRIPAPELLLTWLIPHLAPGDSAELVVWFNVDEPPEAPDTVSPLP